MDASNRPTNSRRTNRLLINIAMLLHLSHFIQSAPLSSYLVSSFTSPDPSLPFNHITVYNVTGDVYIGARERLYQLNPDLTLYQTVNVGTCPSPNQNNINDNKLLLVAPSPYEKLVTCGSCDGYCETRDLANISHNVQRFEELDPNQKVVITGDVPTVGAISRGSDIDEGQGLENRDLYLFTGRSLITDNLYPLSKHTLTNLESFQYTNIYSGGSDWTKNDFIQISIYENYIFYFIHKIKSSAASSHIGRLCPNSLDVLLNSYTEIKINCTQGTDEYSVITAAHIGLAGSQLAESSRISSANGVAYAVLTTPGGDKSALCLFDMHDIQDHFEKSVNGCIQGNDKGKPNDLLSLSNCGEFSEYNLNASQYECTAFETGLNKEVYSYASGVVPLQTEALVTWSGATPTSIITLTERSHTISVVGNEDGHLLKFHVVNDSFAYIYENIAVSDAGGSVLRDMFYNEKEEQITIGISSDMGSQVLKLSIANCSQYETCEECIGVDGGNDGDPYCGWCTLEARCTRYENCSLPDESTRWLSYNAAQCVGISDIQPTDSLPYNQPAQELQITVDQLPTLAGGYVYGCAFDDFLTSATTDGNMVTCTTPPADDVPSIPEGNDNVAVPLSITSSETGVKFVTKDFSFYNCSFHTSCSSCVTSPWACDWCVYDNKCTDDSNTCQAGEVIVIGKNNPSGSGNQGQEYCPQIVGVTEEVLIPVGFERSYALLAKNLPTRDSPSYECTLLIEGGEETVDATYVNDSYIACAVGVYAYQENELTYDVEVVVRWNTDRVIDDVNQTQVTLYKCSVNGGSCSQCLSPESTPSKLECGWCETDCAIAESDVCQGNFLSQNDSSGCPGPKIASVYPVSGPSEGNTRVAIQGTDLGLNFGDIDTVTVAGVACDLSGMEDFYEAGQSVSCATGPGVADSSGSIEIEFSSGSAELEDGFVYRDPQISDFEPKEGPMAGGTRVTIFGEYLDAGRNITARFGDAECIDFFRNTTDEASCTTTGNNGKQHEHVLVMSFDDAERTSGQEFRYVPNPTINPIEDPNSIKAGGLNIAITGTGFDVIQKPLIIVTSVLSGVVNEEECIVLSDSQLDCKSPPYPEDPSSRKKRVIGVDVKEGNITINLDGYELPAGTLLYYEDPVYYDIDAPDKIEEIPESRTLEINGTDLTLASTKDDVEVLIGTDEKCTLALLESSRLICNLPTNQPEADSEEFNLPSIRVHHGNLIFHPGYVRYIPMSDKTAVIAGSVSAVAVVLLIVLGVVGLMLFRRSHKSLDKQAEELELVEKQIQEKVEAAFHDLQADMSEVEQQVKGLGIPFVNTKDYMKNSLFSGLEILPATSDPEYLESDLERAMIMFSRQLNNPDFLISFIQELEEKRKSQRRDRVNIASLITVILASEGKFEYFTEVLERLLEEQISDGADSGRLRALFRRTETIVEKLLSNWLSLCMYHYLKKHVAESLYLLYQSIKIQGEKGPIDIITGQSYFCLNFDSLMEENIPFTEVTLSVVGSNGQHDYYVKVLDVDCITQAKQKILDAAYRRKHIVKQNRANEMDLLWYHPGGEERVLRDLDEFNSSQDNTGAVLLNTVKSCGVMENSKVALIDKVARIDPGRGNYTPVTPGSQMFNIYNKEGTDDTRTRDYCTVQIDAEAGQRFWHLIPEEHMDSGTTKTKLDKEFSAPHLLVTKKTIEPFLGRFLEAIFDKPDMTPLSIKHLFDFFDKMAGRYCSSEKQDEYAEAWKSNSLPQHYWMTTLTHPSHVFDMRQSRSADQSVAVLANMLDNACKKIIPEKKQDSSLNRVLFVKDLPVIIKQISSYYEVIKGQSQPSRSDLQKEYRKIGEEFTGLFSRVGTLKQLYDFTKDDTGDLLDSITEAM